ncbi:hypothetical protein BCR37DRAFT_381100 [Protomyces lactucae-debilis]|uniref:RING-type E3 ubiquitin transferase n=1 Tax=Protomyces lactucae-debilis TaxID=2754530 RepID=A0A1Y2FC39_PROLT|nr:uncharacterized protein BCR37DRAFT_381100 [Protomyces lactucae-debilis]ORY80425.1 hypothetical protein BCR37DRAFT_381100 [Protomyces lactucae-debilis]
MSLATSTVTPSMQPTASPTPTQSTRSNNNSQSPLLFFVALGFGVLFTNLWIIIGVKYCFRYQSARRRGITMSQMNAEIAAASAQQRSGRRRKEKKLMTMEEVNAQFPLQSYKAWRASREKAGLSTEGGMQAVDAETAQVVRQEMQEEKATLTTEEVAPDAGAGELATGVVEQDLEAQQQARRKSLARGETYAGDTIYEVGSSQQARAIMTGKSDKTEESVDIAGEADIADAASSTPATIAGAGAAGPSSTHAPSAAAGIAAADIVSGDTCAICIDTLEDDDDIRGLTCGHAFHAACVDQWLTTRRAICPLCKKDFWVRKLPVAGEDAAMEDAQSHAGVLGMLHSLSTFRMPRWRSTAATSDPTAARSGGSRRRRQGDLEQGSEMTHLQSRPRSRDVTHETAAGGGRGFDPSHLASVHAAQR